MPQNKELTKEIAFEADITVRTPNSEAIDGEEAIDPAEERRLVRKLDLVIFPVFFVIYMMSFLDRINISNAKIQGMVGDLDLGVNNRFNIALFVSLTYSFRTCGMLIAAN